MPEPTVGDRVLTADGQELGTVKRIEDVAFLLDVRGAPDFWLNKEDIDRVEDGVVHMAFPESALEEHEIKYGDIL